MNLCLDNVIFSLQSAGGISRYWGLLCNNISEFNLDVTFYGDSKASNIFKPPHLIENAESKIPYNLLRSLPFQSELPSSAIFHSSYYRISTQKGVSNITTVHDFTYEKFNKGIARLVHSAQKNLELLWLLCWQYHLDLLRQKCSRGWEVMLDHQLVIEPTGVIRHYSGLRR